MRKWIADQVAALGLAMGDDPSTERLLVYAEDLCDIPEGRLARAFLRARREYEYLRLPPVAFIRRMAGVDAPSDGRPGPEEAWARMPKGERMEEDSIVWCEEERTAYGACRSLLSDGDQIGARMAFKERYEKELAEARRHGRPAQWTVSLGYDIEHRLVTLATAVKEGRMRLESALDFVPGERQNDFAQMLPPAEAKGLLMGTVEKLPNLTGLAGVLAKMHMEGTVPEELTASPRPLRKTTSDRSPDESRALRDKANAQLEFLKRSRNGSGNGSARTVDPSDKSCEARILAESVAYEEGEPEAREKGDH
jgi:hypothetical protein